MGRRKRWKEEKAREILLGAEKKKKKELAAAILQRSLKRQLKPATNELNHDLDFHANLHLVFFGQDQCN